MIEHSIDPEVRIAFVRVSGRITDDEALAWFDDLMVGLEGEESIGGLIDTRALEKLDMSSEGLRRVTKRAEASERSLTGSRWAIIAQADEVFGMARMYQILRSEAPYEISVFREVTAAYLWLGIPPPEEDA